MAQVCLAACNLISRTPARLHALCQPRERTCGEYGSPISSAPSAQRPRLEGSWFVLALAWNMGAFGRNPAALVLRNETSDVLARVDHQFLKY